MQRALRRPFEAFNVRALKNCVAQIGFALLTACVFSACQRKQGSVEIYERRAKGTITFNKDVASIVFNNCSGCHRPGESAPFDLLTYADVRKHAKQIADVTERRYMPPWLPDSAVVHFVGERRLSAEQLGLIKQWVEEGAVQGAAKDLPSLPKWNDRWQLGEPDLVVKPSAPFSLAADGHDVYRNLVIPLPLNARRYVHGIEFRANSRAVHHAFFRFDKTRGTRALDGKDGQPGFYGLHTPQTAESPITFASWQPGKVPRFFADDLAWPIETNTDLVLQVHMQPIGKVENIAPEIAFYFNEKPGTAIAFKLPLNSYTIEIPAGATNYVATDSFVLPIDVEVRGVLPHAHYLCREMRGYAELPDGSRQWLMMIRNWDFNWQGDYQFATPLQLPKGTKLVMEYAYDNSTNNVRNPNNPPQVVRYGMSTTDEMAELWLQIVMRSQSDFASLQRALQPRFLNDQIITSEMLLRKNPRDAKAHTDIGAALLMLGRNAEAIERLRVALQIDPNYDEAHYFAGVAYRAGKQFDSSRQELETALRLNPRHARARGNLGLVLVQQGELAAAAKQFQAALELNPQDNIARDMLGQIRQALKQSKN